MGNKLIMRKRRRLIINYKFSVDVLRIISLLLFVNISSASNYSNGHHSYGGISSFGQIFIVFLLFAFSTPIIIKAIEKPKETIPSIIGFFIFMISAGFLPLYIASKLTNYHVSLSFLFWGASIITGFKIWGYLAKFDQEDQKT